MPPSKWYRFLLCNVVLAVQSPQPQILSSQLPAASIRLHEAMNLPSAVTELSGLEGAVLGPMGVLFVGDPNELRVLVISESGAVRTFGRTGEGPGEFRNIREIFRDADGIWVADSRLLRLQHFGWDGKLRRAIGYSTTISTTGGGRMSTRPLTLTDAGHQILNATIVKVPQTGVGRGRSVGDRGLVIADTSGHVVRGIVWGGPASECSTRLSGVGNVPRALCMPDVVTLSGNGRFALTVEDRSDDETATVSATIVDIVEGTRSEAVVSYPRRKAGRHVLDSIDARIRARLVRVPRLLEAYNAQERPEYYPSFNHARVLDDGSAWIRIFEAGGPTARWLVLSPVAVPIGMATLPAEAAPIAGTRKDLWARSTDPDGWEVLIHFVGLPD